MDVSGLVISSVAKGEEKMKFKWLSMLLVLFAMLSGNAMAAIDLTGVTVDTASVISASLIVIAGLAAIWPIRKLIKLFNRS